MGASDTVILVLTHGVLAQTLVETASLIVGKLENVFYINFPKEKDISFIDTKLKKFINENKDKNILIFIDIFGGSCLNVCCKYLQYKNIKVFSGINLPILLEAIMDKNYLSFSELIKKLKEKVSEAVIFVNEKVDKYNK